MNNVIINGHKICGVRHADGRAIEHGTQVKITNNGGRVLLEVAFPGWPFVGFDVEPTADGWLEIPN